jgi:hypothetical protein
MNQNALTQAIIRQIVAHTRCAVCGHHFSINDVRVIGRRENVWAMSVSCRECRTQALLLAAMAEGAMQSLYTDLTPDEWERFRERPPVSVDDVITFHQHMRAYTGDFSEILEEPLPEE